MTQNKDYEYRLRYRKLVGHVHCRLFSRPRGQATYAKCGNLTFCEEEWESFLQAFNNCDVIQEDV